MLKSFLSRKQSILAPLHLKFWVVPFLDTDVKLLFTHTYNQYMALARWNLVFNSEFRTGALKRGWVPVTTKETIQYKRSIKAFERVSITTKLLFWNERRFYHRHVFSVKGEVRAVCLLEGMLRGPKGHLKPSEAFEKLGANLKSPPIPKEIETWLQLNYDFDENAVS